MGVNLDRENFIEWLQGCEPDDEVGIPGSACHCPLANYLKTQYPALEGCLLVDYQDVKVLDNSSTIRRLLPQAGPRLLPQWAVDFILAIDANHKYSITAEQCLEQIHGS